jgi:hypothetical protein
MTQSFKWLVSGWLAVVTMAAPAYAQQFTQASLGNGGVQANQGATDGFFSGDGQSILFFSSSSNLVPSDTNNTTDLFIRNLGTGAVERITVANDGSERSGAYGRYLLGPLAGSSSTLNVSLSHTGRVVAFATTSAFMVSDNHTCTHEGTQEPCVDVYIRDLNMGQTALGSLIPGNNDSYDPQVSADGRFIVFTSLASNFTPQDQNGVGDVYVRDLLGILPNERVSLSSTGQELNKPSWFGRISDGGEWIVFLTEATVVPDADPMPCLTQIGPGLPTPPCGRAYLRNHATGATKRLPIPLSVSPQGTSTGAAIKGLAMSEDGRYIAMHGNAVMDNKYSTFVVVYDRVKDHADVAFVAPFGYRSPEVSLSDNGRMVAVSVAGDDAISRPAIIADRLTHKVLTSPADLPVLDQQPAPARPPVRFNADGLRIIYNEISARVATDTNGTDDVYIFNRDVDGDGMTDVFETKFGLNPSDPSDATLDADADGVTNLQEYVNGTNPKGTSKRYFAEGAANSFFTTRFGVFNPNPAAATVYLEFLGSNGQNSSMPLQLAANGWTSVTLNDVTIQQPDSDFSTVIESDQPVVVDRTMSWDKSGYGSHAETSIEAPATTWFMAEGSTGGSFDLFYLLQNPGDTDAAVTVTYLLPAPAAPVVKQYTVQPKARKTIHLDEEDPAVQFTDVSAKVTSDKPILVERAMYFSTPSQAFAAGHEGAAVTAPANSWFLAEGATGSFFDLFLLLANAETTDADVKVTYLLPSGDPIVKHYDVKAQSRRTVNVDFEDTRLIDTPASTIVESAVPVIAERAMWWPSPNWYEAHLSAGTTTTGTKWALADGLATDTPGTETQTFILIANTGTTAGNADVTLFFGDGTTMTKNFPLNANSRTNVWVNAEFPDAVNKGGYGTIIQSSGVQIVVERAMYSNANGQTWAAGTDALATKLQ